MIRRNFWLLALLNIFVGGMVGLERTTIPLIGQNIFHLNQGAALGAFIISFALSKAIMNLFAGFAADYLGRKKVLLLGWFIGVPVPLLLIWAPTWSWILLANVLLGINQALTWSMTVNMMVDLVPAKQRGFAAGINEFAGYLGVSLLAFLTGLVAARYSLRPEPFYLGIGIVCLAIILTLFIAETKPLSKPAPLRWVRGIEWQSLLGLATNLKDGLVWLSLPLLLQGRGLNLIDIASVVALYPLVWAVGQPFFGPLSDKFGRRLFISLGVGLQGLGLVLLAMPSALLSLAMLAAMLMGLGTAMAYPTLIAAVADKVTSDQRASALGIYRFFRDGGYALGALAAYASVMPLSVVLWIIGISMLLLALVAWFLSP